MTNDTYLLNQFQLYQSLLGQEVPIRKVQPSEARPLLDLINKIMCDGQHYPTNKLPFTMQQEIDYLNHSGQDYCVLVVDNSESMLGFATITRHYGVYVKHVAQLVMGVVSEAWRQGIGSKLLAYAENVARDMKIERLEISIREGDENATNFFLKNNFFLEGKRKQSVKIAGKYTGELFMAKIIG